MKIKTELVMEENTFGEEELRGERHIRVVVGNDGMVRIGGGRNLDYPQLEIEKRDVECLVEFLRGALAGKLPDGGGQ